MQGALEVGPLSLKSAMSVLPSVTRQLADKIRVQSLVQSVRVR